MGKASPAVSNFNAGELSPDFAGRTDVDKYASGAKVLLNNIPMIQGPSKKRPGSRMVQFVKDSSKRTWLRKFIFSQGQAYQIEFGDTYCRFYTNQGQVLNGGVPYEIVSPFTAAMLTNANGTCGIQIEQSGDVLYIACAGIWPQTLTRKGSTNWVFAPYSSPDGPFLTRNQGNSPALYVAPIAGSNTTVDCFATTAAFSASDASAPGRLVRIDAQQFTIEPWTTNISYGHNDLVRYGANTYQMIKTASTTSGPAPPVHTNGVASDGRGGCLWLYLDSGYGIGRVTTYISPTHVVLTVSPYAGQTGKTNGNQYYKFPTLVQANTVSITGITKANPAQVTFTGSFGPLAVGDQVYLTGVQGMTEISEQMYTVLAGAGQTFDLNVDSSAFTTYASGGTALRNASLNWQMGAWGDKAAQTPAGGFPVAVGFYLDRLFWGWGINWAGSVVGQYSSHAQDSFGITTTANAIKGVIADQRVDQITWFAGLNLLLMGTPGGEFGLGPITSTAPLGPDNVQVVRQSNMRSKSIRSQIIESSNFYVQASGKKLMAQSYNFYIDKYDSVNQNRLANHIAGYGVASGIIDIDYHAEPYELVWAVRNDGLLIAYTYDSQDQVTGWSRHQLGGTLAGNAAVECVSTIPAPDGTRDQMWMIVRRVINGLTVRSVEYLEKDFESGDDGYSPGDEQSSICYVDMSAQYSGTPKTVITGLSYLEGETVQVVRDGGGHPDCVVSGGKITLQTPGSVVQVGLACPSIMAKMRMETGTQQGTSQGKLQRVSTVVVRLKNTLGGKIGMLGCRHQDLMVLNDTDTPLGSPPPLFSGDTPIISLDSDSELYGCIVIIQDQPFPQEIIGIYPRVETNEPSPG